jgi:protein-S-isoprenylcysteine O-methyltransferase Ste14
MVRTTKFLAGVVLFVGLPFLGWGLRDITGFMANPARLAYVVVVILIQTVLVIRWPGVGRQGRAGVQTVSSQRIVVILMQVLSLAIIILAPFCDRRGILVFGGSLPVRFLGLALFALGFIGINWAEATLGRQFSVQVTLQEDHQLVTSGPYRMVRHPRYACILLYNLGLALLFRSWLALLLLGLLAVVLLWRIQAEEALMHQGFGAEWESYVQRTKRLIPWVY